MKLMLAENIRSYRKQRKMTQEHLADALGVTVGAVYKWESGQSVPELRLLVEIADFFNVSVDVLLGYEMKDNRLKAILERLTGCINNEDPEGLPEAEKALARFPHSFDVVYLAALLFMIIGGKNRDGKMLARSSELLDESLVLLPQCTDRNMSEISIYHIKANVLILMGRAEEAAELLKNYNREGIFSDLIGMTLSLMCVKPEEAQPFLSHALLDSLSRMVQTVIGKAYAYSLGGDQDSAESLLKWGTGMLNGLKQPEMTGYIDQSCSFLYLLLSFVYLKKGRSAQAEEAMRKSLETAACFDSQPTYDARSIRFVDSANQYYLHCVLGRTARDSLGFIVNLIGDDNLTTLWKGMTVHE